MRGDAYRRRDELEGRAQGPAAGGRDRPGATRPREAPRDVNYARHFGLPPAAEHYGPTSTSMTVLHAFSTSSRWRECRSGQPTLGIEALRKAAAIEGTSRKPTT